MTQPLIGEDALVLGIETSCDETAVAVVRGGREILSNVIASQADLHARFGGVVPEIASRAHVEQMPLVVEQALREASVGARELAAVAATRGPGLIGALLVGYATGKAMAAALEVPFAGVHHIEGHVFASVLTPEGFDPPFIALVVSGGHTSLFAVRELGTYELLGETLDDAAGEAFDKIARFLGLEYPGGPEIDRMSLLGDPEAVTFPRAMIDEAGFDVSYSGLKTAVINYVRKVEAGGGTPSVEDVAASFQQAVVDVQVTKTMAAVGHTGVDRVFLCGGVAANSGLRRGLAEACGRVGVKLHVPPMELCTDNAAMVAACGTAMLRRGRTTGLNAAPDPNLPLGSSRLTG